MVSPLTVTLKSTVLGFALGYNNSCFQCLVTTKFKEDTNILLRRKIVDKAMYEKYILSEIRLLPLEALPKILRLISFVKTEFIEKTNDFNMDSAINNKIERHKIRELLASSNRNWAQDIIDDRKDRV